MTSAPDHTAAHDNTAHDHTAVWLHVVSGIRGVADRVGRIVPVLAIGIPLVAIGAPLSALGFGDPSVLPSVIGVSGGVLLVGVGLSSLFSARFPYPASRPGDSPFHAPQSVSAGGSTVPTLTFLATVALALPSVWLGWMGLVHGGAYPAWSLVVGLGIGVVTLVAGVVGDVVRGSFVSGGPLPFMPSARVGGSLRWDDGRYFAGGDVRHGFAQTRVSQAACARADRAVLGAEGELGREPGTGAPCVDVSTPAYTVLNLNVGVTLVVGALWGRLTWGVFWQWDARLTTTALLFVTYIGYLAVRRLDCRATCVRQLYDCNTLPFRTPLQRCGAKD